MELKRLQEYLKRITLRYLQFGIKGIKGIGGIARIFEANCA